MKQKSGFRRRVKRFEKVHHHNYEFDRFEPPLKVVSVGISRWREGDFFTNIDRRTFSINILTQGNACFDQNGSAGTLECGDVFLAHTGRTQHFFTGSAGYLHKRFLLADGPMLDTFLRSTGLVERDYVRPRSPGKVMRLMSRAYTTMQRKESNFTQQLSLIIHEILMELGRSITQEYPAEIRRAIEYMKRNLDANLTLEHISNEARLSVRHCNRLFHRYLGISPMHFFMDQRMDWARSLLVNTAMSVKEVAATLGFDDPLYFSLRFRKHFGSSPKMYRLKASRGQK